MTDTIATLETENGDRLSSANLRVSHQGVTVYLNAALVHRQGIGDDAIAQLKSSHVVRLHLFRLMERETDAGHLLALAHEFDQLEFVQQRLWNFDRNASYHRWHSVPGCTCNNQANDELMGRPFRLVSLDCPIHAQLLSPAAPLPADVPSCLPLYGDPSILETHRVGLIDRLEGRKLLTMSLDPSADLRARALATHLRAACSNLATASSFADDGGCAPLDWGVFPALEQDIANLLARVEQQCIGHLPSPDEMAVTACVSPSSVVDGDVSGDDGFATLVVGLCRANGWGVHTNMSALEWLGVRLRQGQKAA